MPENRRTRAISFGLVLALMVATFSLDYTVKPGDNMTRIARDHGISLSELIAANSVPNPDLIFPGQVLVIPGQEIVHTVVAGDTLTRLAATYGTSISALASANSISNPNLIRLGAQLQIPGSTGGSGGGSAGPYDPFRRSGRSHVVRPGDSLTSIADQYPSVTVQHLSRANGIIDGVIYNGTRLFLDGPDFVGQPTDEAVTNYVVQSGDRLGDIAHAHSVSVGVLTSTNNISNPNLITPGQTLQIPIGAQWVCPVANGSFFNDWGFPRAGGRYHEGIDIFAPQGTPVYAPVSGTVEQRTGALGGNQFNLTGSDGVLYIGGHMSSFGKSGEVQAGDIVGYVGNTGNATGTSPHLHFGMYYEGAVINPYPSLIANGCR